jgi:RNA polymerase sigma factor (sigma-70 family)
MANRHKSLRSRKARNKLVEQWQFLPGHVWTKSKDNPSLSRLGRDDAVQAGMLGLIRAAEIWDETKGVKFVTYAYRAVLDRMLKASRQNRVVHVPDDMLCGTSAHRARYFALYLTDAARRCRQLPDDYDRADLPLPDTHAHDDLHAALDRLDPRERECLLLLFFEGLLLREVGERWGLCKERVRQIKERALTRLRALLLPSHAD